VGSSGSGRFGNYGSGGSGGGSGGGGSGIGGSGVGGSGVGGSSANGEIVCPSKIENIRLEDVAVSEYYIKNKALPLANTAVYLSDKIHNGRLVVKEISSDIILGNLPTQYNFLVNCIKKDMQYKGVVISANEKPIPFIVVTLYA